MMRRVTRELDRAHALTLDLDRALRRPAVDLDGERARALDLARDLDCTLDGARGRGRAPDRARDLERARFFARELDHTLDRALDRARGLDLDLARRLERAFKDAHDLTRDVARALDSAALGASTGTAGGTRSTPGRSTRTLVALAVRLLPVAQRARYRDEFGVELVELPRQQQRGYALRALARAWELRKALVEAVRTSDSQPARRAER
jgi:hypothetical protein